MASPYGASQSHSLDTSHFVGLLWKSDQPDTETCTRHHSTYSKVHTSSGIRTHNPSEQPRGHCDRSYIYRVSQEECTRPRESVPYVKVYRYNPKQLYQKLNGYGDNGQRKVGLLAVPNTATCTADVSRDSANVLETGMQC